MLDFLLIIVIVVAGFQIKHLFASSIDTSDSKTLSYLWMYHLLFGLIYWFYISFVSGGDALHYYLMAKEQSLAEVVLLFILRGSGTAGMFMFTFLPAKIFTFLTVSLLYTLVGYIGMVFFYVLTINNIKFNSRIFGIKIFPLIFFLPNFHFWSAGLGKDTICFFCIGLFFYAMQKPRKHYLKIFIALGLSYIVRPHITIFLVGSFGVAFMLSASLKFYQKALFAGFFLIIFVVLFSKFMSFVNLDSFDSDSIQSFSETKTKNLSRSTTGSSVDISSYPYPFKVLTFLYRPFFFDINNILAVIASFENLVLLILSIKFISCNPLKLWRKATYFYKGVFIFFLIGALTFPLILGNLGIMLRQKNMFLPAFFFICLWAFSYKQEQYLLKQK